MLIVFILIGVSKQQRPGWSKYTVLSVALICTVTLCCGRKGRHAYDLANSGSERKKAVMTREEGFGSVSSFEKLAHHRL